MKKLADPKIILCVICQHKRVMDKVQQELSAAIKTNFALLGLDVSDPSVVCNCTITPGGKKYPATPSASLLISAPVPSVPSQFVPGGAGALTAGQIPLSLVDPGNEPFIFPPGTTIDGMLAQQSGGATERQRAADAAAAALATKLTVQAASDASVAPVMAPISTVSVGAPTTLVPATVTSIASVAPPLVTAPIEYPPPAKIVESFGPRLHTLKLGDNVDTGNTGWGLCGRRSGTEMLVFAAVVMFSLYILNRSTRLQ